MIRFVGNNAEGLPLKRKQSQRACESCRKRKKRCVHQPTAVHRGARLAPLIQASPTLSDSPDTSITAQHPAEIRTQYQQSNRDSSNIRQSTRLLSPTTAASATSLVPMSHTTEHEDEDEDHDPRFIGELNPEGIFVVGASPGGAMTAAATSSPEDVVGVWIPKKWVNAAKSLPGPILSPLLPYLEDECSRALPGPSDYDQLYHLYLDEVHPILPIIHLESYQRQQDRPKMLLKLAICLTVASNPKGKRHLKQSPKDFTANVTQLLRSAIDNRLVRDKQVMIQLFVILSLSTQLSDDRHASAEFASRAVSYIHTGGLHLGSANQSDNLYVTRLFCCVYALDRLNAAVQGRPVLMHDRDIGRNLLADIQKQDSLFQLLLQVILQLDKVIALYRPSLQGAEDDTKGNRSIDQDFPGFEDLLSACGSVRAPAALVATVETLYHAVAMLSCRSQSLSELTRNSASHTRQNLSAASITSIAGNEFRGQLAILPFVPYAMSLALRVSYRDLRLSKSSFTRSRARRQLLHVCTLLREQGDVFSSSMQMAELAEETVREMDKVCSTVAGQRRTSLVPAGSTTTSSAIPVAVATTTNSDSIPQSEPRQGHVVGRGYIKANVSSTTGTISRVDSHGLQASISLADDYDMHAFDPSQFHFDLDIFDHFDPNFDIEAIDAALANSIDPCIPIDIGYWESSST